MGVCDAHKERLDLVLQAQPQFHNDGGAMIINITRRTTRETHNPSRRIRITRPWGDTRETTVRIPQGDNLTLWRGGVA